MLDTLSSLDLLLFFKRNLQRIIFFSTKTENQFTDTYKMICSFSFDCIESEDQIWKNICVASALVRLSLGRQPANNMETYY